MKLILDKDLAEDVLLLCQCHGYTPDEIISIGIKVAGEVLEANQKGWTIITIKPGGQDRVFCIQPPRGIDDIAKRYLEKITPAS